MIHKNSCFESYRLSIVTLYDLVSRGTNTNGTNQCYGSGGTTGSGGVYVNPCIHSGTIADIDINTVWYNYVTITAGTIKNSSATDTTGNMNVATQSICPRGWALANKTQMNSITGNDYIAIFSPVSGGFYRNGVLEQGGSSAVWFSSEPYDGSARYYLAYAYNSGLLNLGDQGRRRDQGYLRCVQAS